MYRLIQDKKIFMNTAVKFTAWTDVERLKTQNIFQNAFLEFERVAKNYSRFDPKSELSKLNRSSERKVKVSKELFFLIKKSLEYAKKTDGFFDPTIIDLLEAYGYDAKYNFSKLEDKNLLKEISRIARNRSSYQDIKLDENELTIKLEKKQRIDLGGIGKGYAIDLAYDKMKKLENFLIDAGGDIKACGNCPEGDGWPVALDTPQMESPGVIRLKNMSLCCSGSWARKVKIFHHLINPKTGKPQNLYNTVFILSKNAIDADAYATSIFISGARAETYIKKLKLQTIIVTTKKELLNYNFPELYKIQKDISLN